LDAYAITGDPRWKAAALRVAEAFKRTQREDGTWAWVNRHSGQYDISGHHHGVQMDHHDPGEILWFLGRLRVELNTDAYQKVERDGLQWMLNNSAASSWWRTQRGHNEIGFGSINSKTALGFLEYYLTDAPDVDEKVARGVLRYIEDQHVSWPRAPGEGRLPFASLNTAKSPGNVWSTAQAAHLFILAGRRFDDELLVAKGRALLAGLLARQFPNGGFVVRWKGEKPDPRFNEMFALAFARVADGLLGGAAALQAAPGESTDTVATEWGEAGPRRQE
jgi:hypothetical protein